MTLYINPKLVSSVGFDGSSSIHPSIKNSSSPTYSPISSLISHLSRLPLPIPHPSSSILNPSQCGLCSGWGRWVSGLGGETTTQKLISQRLCQTLSEAEPVLADDGWSKGCTVMNPIKFPLTPCALSSTTAQSSPRSGEELIWWVGWPMKILISLSSVFGPRHRFRVLLASQVTKSSWSMTSWHTSISSRHQVGGESLVGVKALECLLYSYSRSKRTVLWFGSDSHRSIDRSRSKSIDPPGSSPHQSQAKCPRSLKDHHQVCCQAMMMISSLETTSGRPKKHVTLLYHALLIYPTLWELDGLRARWSRPIGQQNPSHPIHSPNLMSFRNQLLPSPRLSWHRWMVLRILELEPEDDCQALVWVDELGWEMRAVEDGVREVMRGMSSYIYGLRYDLVQRMTWKLFGQLSIRLSVSLLLTRLGWGSVDVSYRNEMYFTNSGPTYSLKLWFEWKVTRLPLLLDESR